MKKLSFVLIIMAALAITVPAFAQNAPIATPYMSTMPCTNLTVNLSYGKYDTTTYGQVSVLQNFLHMKGYLSVSPTGYFGPMTRAAVKTFQYQNGLNNDGIVGVQTRAHILAKDCNTIVVPPPMSLAPTITAMNPAQGTQGTVVTLYGTGFSTDTIIHFGIGGITPVVTGNGTMASFTIPGYIGQYCKPGMLCTMIAQVLNAGTYPVYVENMGGISNSMNFTITRNPNN